VAQWLRSEWRKRLTFWYELQRKTVVAPSLTCGLRPIIEYMPLVTTTPGAVILGPRKDEPEISLCAYVTWDSLGEARPTCAAVELGLGCEQGEPASGAEECAWPRLVVKRVGERAFRCLLEQNAILLSREDLPPFLV